ncbi:MAG: nucleotidyltransferase family protein [Dysgonamonadaceae bacterium]|jgi:glucose-1-phosphate thymidylyltransferase|nr:nucleotidyltransferase family protein [Dysgonamonadaceae bacterium]
MKNIVLAAGYATRLYPITENFPKPLLAIGNSTIMDRLIEDIDRIHEIDEHIIVANHKFQSHFQDWKRKSNYQKPITIIDDGSTENENRLGAVKDLLLAMDVKKLDSEDLLVVAADNLLDFSFAGFVDFFKEKQTSLIMTYEEPEIRALQRTGVIVIDAENKVLEMREKPENPKTHHAVPPFYLYKKDDSVKIRESVAAGCKADAPGDLLQAMLGKTTFHAWPMPGKRIDIGTMETYLKLSDSNLE